MNRISGDQLDRKAQYAAIGQFVVEFEWICWLLRFHACTLLQIHGLTKWPLGQVILNQRVFTGEPLFACCASMVAECLGPKHPLIKELEGLSQNFQDLCKIRNDLLHAFYLTGSDGAETTNGDAPTEDNLARRTLGQRGARIQIHRGTMAELQRHVTMAATVKQKVKEFVPKVVNALAADGIGVAHG